MINNHGVEWAKMIQNNSFKEINIDFISTTFTGCVENTRSLRLNSWDSFPCHLLSSSVNTNKITLITQSDSNSIGSLWRISSGFKMAIQWQTPSHWFWYNWWLLKFFRVYLIANQPELRKISSTPDAIFSLKCVEREAFHMYTSSGKIRNLGIVIVVVVEAVVKVQLNFK